MVEDSVAVGEIEATGGNELFQGNVREVRAGEILPRLRNGLWRNVRAQHGVRLEHFAQDGAGCAVAAAEIEHGAGMFIQFIQASP
jgi:hypothetical protein